MTANLFFAASTAMLVAALRANTCFTTFKLPDSSATLAALAHPQRVYRLKPLVPYRQCRPERCTGCRKNTVLQAWFLPRAGQAAKLFEWHTGLVFGCLAAAAVLAACMRRLRRRRKYDWEA
mmetsp:Transcript_98698/g.190584  ORF Transcript_98698/g.190584 Transcript_98698/m.190584 type:complete len:121 (+) Transcript_98698:57-419(+)